MKIGLQASKWLAIQALLDREEMSQLFNALGDFLIFRIGGIQPQGQSALAHEAFLSIYDAYLLNQYTFEKPSFSVVFTKSKENLAHIPIEGGKELLRPIKPVIQIQHHRIGYSREERKFRPMVLGSDTISWGLQFTFPQLYQDPKTEEIQRSSTSADSGLFRTLSRWMRSHTIPTPFVVEKQTIHVPMRLGKQCLSWINTHPQLLAKNIHVHRTV